jgi:quercetin dioxygenase-like cupin family protein
MSVPESAQLYRLEDLPGVMAVAGIVRRVVPGTGATLLELRMAPGAMIAAHSHPHEQFSLVQRGVVRCRLGAELERTIVVEAGGVLHIPGELRHLTEAIEESVVVEVFAPAREELHGG